MKHNQRILLLLFKCVVLSSLHCFATTYTVNSTDDVDDGTCNGAHCSLREAINAANGGVGGDVIDFNLPVTSVITVTSALPTISTNTLTIDGFALGGTANTVSIFSGSALNPSYNVEISNGGTIPTAFIVSGNYNTINGLVMQNFGDGTPSTNDIAITLSGSNNTVTGCYIGVGTDGTTAGTSTQIGIKITGNNNIVGNGTKAGVNLISGLVSGTGVQIFTPSTGNSVKGNIIGPRKDGSNIPTGSSQGFGITSTFANSNTIGGTGAEEGNLTSGNTAAGIYLFGGSGNILLGNRVGTSANGLAVLTTGDVQVKGIWLNASASNTIGGSTSSHRNLISANTSAGIYFQGDCAGTQVKGNYIGIGSDGTSYISSNSQDYGVQLTSITPDITIGGTNTGEGNIISGNGNSGIANSYGVYIGSRGNTVVGNIIGPKVSGTTALDASNNQNYGIYLDNKADNVIGGSSAAYRNVISDNRTYGVYVTGANSTGTVIKGNYIGIAANGTSFITSNTQDYGIYLASTTPATIIGGTNAGEGNVISGNSAVTAYGIRILNTGNSIYGNIVGAAASGTTSLGASNQEYGIHISTANNTIGSSTSGHRNVVSDNTLTGIGIFGVSASGNVVKGNYVGIAANGTSLITGSSQDYGIGFTGPTPSVVIGGTATGEGNVISGNTTYGIQCPSSDGHIIYGNIIGPAASGTTSLGANNQARGIHLSGSEDNIIGGASPGQGNTISDNTEYGIYMTGASSSGSVIQGNYIGLATDGTSTIIGSSQDYGIYIISSANNNIIGGSLSNESNKIASHTVDGVYVSGAASSGNLISRNLIYSNTNKAINLNSSGNANYAAPTVAANFTANNVSGTAAIGDFVEVFEAIISSSVTTANVCQSAEKYLGSAIADGSGNWSLSGLSLSANGTPIATARNNGGASSSYNTSEFGCPPSISLPIELLSFTAIPVNNQYVKLDWLTASEINNDYFTIERSVDGIEFEIVSIVEGAGNSVQTLSYTSNDYTPYYGTSYYRLKQTDFDGSFEYSDLVPVKFMEENSASFSIYPNPVSSDDIVSIVFLDVTNTELYIIIHDILGKEVYRKRLVSEGKVLGKTRTSRFNLPRGVYTITVEFAKNKLSKKLIIM